MADLDCLLKFGFLAFENTTQFTKEQLFNYCTVYIDFDRFNTAIDSTVGISMVVTGALGLFNYVFTFLTFSRGDSFEGPSFIYHKAMALVELVLMAIMLQYGVLRILHFPGGYPTIFWDNQFWSGWMFGDTVKLFVLCMTAFVSFERVIAVWFPMHFRLVDRISVVAISIAVSGLIGSLHLTSIAAMKVIRRDDGTYGGDRTEFGKSFAYECIDDVIYFIKLSLGVAILLMCIAIVFGIILRQRKAAAMSLDGRRNWKTVKRACYLQLIVAVTALIDQAAWVAFRMVDQPYPSVGTPAVQWLPYETAMDNLWRMRRRVTFETIQVFTGELDHGGRFYFYLIFHRTFREVFKVAVLRKKPETSTSRVHALASD